MEDKLHGMGVPEKEKQMTLRAMLFDLDGTITRPLLDFPTIKREMGLAPTAFILEALEAMTPEERRRAMEILERHEDEAAAKSQLNDGAGDLLAALARRKILTGIITRNSQKSLEVVLARHRLRFDAAVCRDHAAPKPSPAGVLLAMKQLNVRPEETVYVGDHTIDVAAGRAAGTRTIWVTNGRLLDPLPQADYEVVSPGEIIALLEVLEIG
jgi:HAD superfamily hydrolase (TIGR01509 family)